MPLSLEGPLYTFTIIELNTGVNGKSFSFNWNTKEELSSSKKGEKR